jgi:hypothetical protein
VAELVDAPDSKSGGAKAPCRFEPDLRYTDLQEERLCVEEPRFLHRGSFTATILQPVS